jgi:hypothetical protein
VPCTLRLWQFCCLQALSSIVAASNMDFMAKTQSLYTDFDIKQCAVLLFAGAVEHHGCLRHGPHGRVAKSRMILTCTVLKQCVTACTLCCLLQALGSILAASVMDLMHPTSSYTPCTVLLLAGSQQHCGCRRHGPHGQISSAWPHLL